MIYSGDKTVSGTGGQFDHPEKLPTTDEQRRQWQEENKEFWEKHSMRYDWKEEIKYPEFSKEFYQEIDRRFIASVREPMPWKHIPFDQWIDYRTIANQDVLEIGVGNGTHAQLLASHAKSYTGIDLTAYAQKSTATRLESFGIPGTVLQMDAEKMQFPDASFDFVWSWGVIHHSSNTDVILREIHRVLRPGGKTVIMVYYRSLWSYYLGGALLGVFKGQFFKGRNIHQINQSRTDGALARYYTFHSWKQLVRNNFTINRLETLGNKGDLLPIPGNFIKRFLLGSMPPAITRLGLKQLRMGSFLICEMTKK